MAPASTLATGGARGAAPAGAAPLARGGRAGPCPRSTRVAGHYGPPLKRLRLLAGFPGCYRRAWFDLVRESKEL